MRAKAKTGQTASRKEECRMEKKSPHPSLLTKTLADTRRRMSKTDVLGSWTGVVWEDEDEEPVQDADDL